MQQGTVLGSNKCPKDCHVMKLLDDALKRVENWGRFGRKKYENL